MIIIKGERTKHFEGLLYFGYSLASVGLLANECNFESNLC